VGTNSQLSFPCTTPNHGTFVVTFLAGSVTPIARRMESWTLDETGQKLQLDLGLCAPVGPGQASPAQVGWDGEPSAIGRALASGVPCVSEDANAEPHRVGITAAAANRTSLVAIPLVSGDQVTKVVALYF